MMIPYRARRALRRLFIAVLVLLLAAAALLLCWLLWLNRYVIYDRYEGARLDFQQSLQYPPGETAVPPEPMETVEIHYGSAGGDDTPVNTELVRFSGYYVTLEELLADFDGVKQKLEALPGGSVILLNIKDVRSWSYYTTSVGMQSEKFDVTKMDTLIAGLKSRGHYLIARIPAFQEYDYILADQTQRVPYGLSRKGGNGSLWLDTEGPCYWLNPTSDGTLTYLIQTVTEIRSKGFNEVVFADYRFPKTDKIAFEGDPLQALTDTAAKLVRTCSTDTFAVSFTRTAADLTLPEGRTRLYLEGVSAADAASLAGQAGFEDADAHVVFLTDSGDTRFDEFSVLRPLDSAHE